jgi:hypothetical protein
VNRRAPRLVAGAAVLVILAIVGVLLVPPYAANWRLQSYLNDLADDPAVAQKPLETLRVDVLNRSARLGLPVQTQDVHVGRTESGVEINVLYIVHVDLAGYTIDLHFRPAAGG